MSVMGDVLTVDVVRHSGALVVTALVEDLFGQWYESRTFYGYSRSQACSEFVRSVDERGFRFVTE